MRKVFGRIWILALTLFVLTATVLPASAATVTQDDLTVTLTTDKSEYSANESITVEMTVENNNRFSVEDVKLEFKIPGGYNSQTQGDTNATFNLGPMERTTQRLEIDPDQSSNVDTGDHSLLGMWGFLAVISAALVVALTVLYRKNAKVFSMLLCLMLVASMLPVSALAADAEDAKTIILSETVNVDDKEVTVTGTVTYRHKEPLDLASMQIVQPDDASPTVNTAAKELRSYVEQMTGTTLAIVNESDASGAGIYIGATEFATEHDITCPKGNKFGEGWVIQAVDGNLVLTGQTDRGTLYAVYHLLEDALGVRWWNLWDEYVPTGDALVSKDYSDSGVPFMDYRAIHINGEYLQNMDQIKNRENGWVGTQSSKYGGAEPFGSPAHVHTFSRYFSAKSADETQNGWFAVNANQTTEGDRQLCLSNKELLAAMKTKLVNYIESDRANEVYARYYDVSPNDNSNFCQCENCTPIINKYGLSGYVLLFVNELANHVKDAGYKDVYVETLAYSDYADPPKEAIEIADNLVIRFASSDMDILHDINHPNNADFKSRLEAWSEIIPEGNMYVWDYAVTGATDGVFTTMYKYGENYAKFVEEGVNGMFLQMENPIDTDFWDMKYWLNIKLMEDPYLAMDEEGNYSQERYNALMDEFIYGFYGDAAGPYIRSYLDYMSAQILEDGTRVGHSSVIIEADWLTVEDILKGAELFDKAFAAAGDDEELLKRLRAASSGFDRVVIENWRTWQKQAKERGIEFTLDEQKIGYRLATGLQEMIEQRGKIDASGEKLLTRYKRYLGDVNPLPDELQGIDLRDIRDYPAVTNTLHAHSIQPDSTSLLEEAIVVDTNSITDEDRDTYYKVSSEKGLRLTLVRPGGKPGTSIGRLLKDDIIADGNWHLYEFKNILIEYSDYKFLDVLFRDSQIQNWPFAEDMSRLEGKYVDVYLSMKVTGDVTFEESLPVYHIERIIAVEHSYTNYVESSHATATYNGEKLASAYCDYGCGAVHTRTVSGQEVPDFLANVHADQIFGVTFNDSAAWSSSGEFVSDSAAATGTAFKLTDSSGSYGANASGNVLPIFVSYNTGGTNYTDHKWSITKSMLDGNTDGGYHFYEAQPTANNKLVHTETSEGLTYNCFQMFRNNALKSANNSICQQLAARGSMDSEVQVYASIKYEVKNYIFFSYYIYYVDQIFIVKK